MSFLPEVPPDPQASELFESIQSRFGFVPNLYRAQTRRTDIMLAHAQLVRTVLFKEGALPRREKEYIFLVCSAANLSTYCVTAHCEMVRMLGIDGPEPEQVALDHTATKLPLTTKALLNFVRKLNNKPTKVEQRDVDALRTYGYSDQQILEAVAVVGTAKFANYLAFGLGTVPDFDSSKIPLLQGSR